MCSATAVEMFHGFMFQGSSSVFMFRVALHVLCSGVALHVYVPGWLWGQSLEDPEWRCTLTCLSQSVHHVLRAPHCTCPWCCCVRPPAAGDSELSEGGGNILEIYI